MDEKTKKLILLTNDDGIEAGGLSSLYESLCKQPEYDVRIVAPDKERSAVGHAITVFDPIPVKKEYKDGKFYGYAVDGTPADCVKLAISSIFEKKPDLLISGINKGANMGGNIIYSGTVSAATEGTIYGVPSIAISIDNIKGTDYTYAASFAAIMAEKVLFGLRIPKSTLLNINVPDVEGKDIRGVKVTHQSDVTYKDLFIKRVDPRGRDYYWMDGEFVEVHNDKEGDYSAVKDNYISITPIHFDMTDYKNIKYFKENMGLDGYGDK